MKQRRGSLSWLLLQETWMAEHPGMDLAQNADFMTDDQLEAELTREYLNVHPSKPAREILTEVREHLDSSYRTLTLTNGSPRNTCPTMLARRPEAAAVAMTSQRGRRPPSFRS
jgi:hypothetical protein